MSRKIKKLLLVVSLFIAVFAVAHFALALDVGLDQAAGTGLAVTDPRIIVANVIRIILGFLGIIAVGLVIYAGWLWMTAGGNEERIEQAKKILTNAVIGLVIVLASFAIASYVLSRLIDATGGGPGGGGICDPACSGAAPYCCGGVCQADTCGNIPPGGGPGNSCDANPLTPVCDADDFACGANKYCDTTSCTCKTDDLPGEGEACLTNPLDAQCVTGQCAAGLSCSDDCLCEKTDQPGEGENCDSDPGADGCQAVTCANNLVCSSGDNCTCVKTPLIAWVSPVDDSDNPNGAVGNFITIGGRYFGTTAGQVIFLGDPNNASDDKLAAFPNIVNPLCNNFWQDDQIVVVVPSGAVSGPLKVIDSKNYYDTTDNNRGARIKNFLVNNLDRPGICQLDPNQGKQNDTIAYQGIKLLGASPYFGNLANKVGAGPNFDDNKIGTAKVPNITTGKTTSFVAKGSVFSNYLGFTKLVEPYSGPVISSFNPGEGSAGQYVTISGRGFGAVRGIGPNQSHVYFGDSLNGTEASYDFPKVCADSIWSDRQVIVKVPPIVTTGVGLRNGDYKITMQIGSWPAIDTDALSPSTFKADSTLPLAPSLCKINPIMGRANSPISLWGEYFGANSEDYSKVKFQLNHDQVGAAVTSWGVDSEPVPDGTRRPDKAVTTVHQNTVTGPVKAVKTEVIQGTPKELIGNGLNFTVGVCRPKTADTDDCGASSLCCSAGTPYAGECKAFKRDARGNVVESTEQGLCFPKIKSCVYEWNFSTGLKPQCRTDQQVCGRSCCDLNDCSDASYNYGAGKCGDTICPVGEVTCDNQCCAVCDENGTCSPDEGDPCYNGGTPGNCDISQNHCDSSLTCDRTDCICKKPCNSNTAGTTTCTPVDSKCTNPAMPECNDQTCLCEASSIESCSGYGDQCAASYSCPNSPGQCSTNQASCECCCDIGKNNAANDSNPDCCTGLSCGGTCGTDVSLTDGPGGSNIGLGQCTGCANAGTTQKQHNDACNCSGASGKYCDDSINPNGVCKDCAQLSTGDLCSDKGIGTCCVDAENNNACRDGAGVYDIGQTGSPNYAYCSYFPCNTGTGTCGAATASSNLPVYKTLGGLNGCTAKCTAPPQFGESCAKVMPDPIKKCDYSLCTGFSCLTESGVPTSAPSCGTCCCDPSKKGSNPSDAATYDRCKALDTKFTCVANKGNCSSTDNANKNKRGLCCGCAKDSECGNAATTGCGSDTCCQSRPSVTFIVPADGAGNDGNNKVCRNALIQATFDQAMQINTFAGNVIVAGEYGVEQCPVGTEYLTAVYKPSVFAKIKFWLAKLPLINKLFVREARALSGNFCAILGSVSGHNTADNQTVLEFKLQKVLDPSRKYYVIIKGDSDTVDALKDGVLSQAGIGLSGSGEQTFNGVGFKGKIWSFTTRPSSAADSGICQVDSVAIDPSSYLFKAAASEQPFQATAYSADGQAVTPILGVYNWQWGWTIDNQSVVKFKTDEDAADDTSSHTLVAQNIKDASTLLHAKTTITQDTINSTTGATAEGAAQIYVFLCANPWPTYQENGSWVPYRDSTKCTVPGTGCPDTGFEVYYCRDAGGPGTADDLPAILSDNAVIRGSTTDILKELYFFREGLPNVAGINLATTTNNEIKKGGKAGLVWSAITVPTGQILDKYQIYYGTTSGKYTDSVDAGTVTSKEISGLTNDRKYYFAVTAKYKSGAESAYSNETNAIPKDTTPPTPTQPQKLKVSINPAVISTASVSWQANTDDTVSYKVYYGASKDAANNIIYGASIKVDKNKCSGSVCAANVTSLNQGTTYYFVVTALDAAANESAKLGEKSLLIPLPRTPLNLEVAPTDVNTALVSWAANNDYTSSYKIYYGTASGDLNKTLSVEKNKCSSTVCTAVITGLISTTTYYFAATALDIKPNESAKSSVKNLTTAITPVSRCRADLIKILVAIGTKRDQKKTHLYGITGSNCSACYDCELGRKINEPACIAQLTRTYNNLGFTSVPKDPWGNIYLVDENEYENPDNPETTVNELCRQDTLFSTNSSCGGMGDLMMVPFYSETCK